MWVCSFMSSSLPPSSHRTRREPTQTWQSLQTPQRPQDPEPNQGLKTKCIWMQQHSSNPWLTLVPPLVLPVLPPVLPPTPPMKRASSSSCLRGSRLCSSSMVPGKTSNSVSGQFNNQISPKPLNVRSRRGHVSREDTVCRKKQKGQIRRTWPHNWSFSCDQNKIQSLLVKNNELIFPPTGENPFRGAVSSKIFIMWLQLPPSDVPVSALSTAPKNRHFCATDKMNNEFPWVCYVSSLGISVAADSRGVCLLNLCSNETTILNPNRLCIFAMDAASSFESTCAEKSDVFSVSKAQIKAARMTQDWKKEMIRIFPS